MAKQKHVAEMAAVLHQHQADEAPPPEVGERHDIHG